MNAATYLRRGRPYVPRHVDPSAEWVRLDEFRVNGRVLSPGTEFSVRGERGRFRFLYAIETAGGSVWVDAIGGPKHCRAWRSFRPGRIRTVHRIAKTRENVT